MHLVTNRSDELIYWVRGTALVDLAAIVFGLKLLSHSGSTKDQILLEKHFLDATVAILGIAVVVGSLLELVTPLAVVTEATTREVALGCTADGVTWMILNLAVLLFWIVVAAVSPSAGCSILLIRTGIFFISIMFTSRKSEELPRSRQDRRLSTAEVRYLLETTAMPLTVFVSVDDGRRTSSETTSDVRDGSSDTESPVEQSPQQHYDSEDVSSSTFQESSHSLPLSAFPPEYNIAISQSPTRTESPPPSYLEVYEV